MKTKIPVKDAVNSGKPYVYLLCYPDGVPFYVGKGTNDRIYHHIGEARRTNKQTQNLDTIRKTLNEKKEISLCIDSICETDKQAFKRENELILQYGRESENTGTLKNIKPGNNGSSYTKLLSRVKSQTSSLKLLEIHIKPSLNYSAKMPPMNFQVLSETWTGESIDIPFGEDRGRKKVVGMSSNIICREAPVHVVRVKGNSSTGMSSEGGLVYGGDNGVRVLEDAGDYLMNGYLRPGCGYPLVWIEDVEDLPPKVREVVGRRNIDFTITELAQDAALILEDDNFVRVTQRIHARIRQKNLKAYKDRNVRMIPIEAAEAFLQELKLKKVQKL